MSSNSPNPVLYAAERMHRLVNQHGQFTFAKRGHGPVGLRLHLQQHREVTLLQSSTNLQHHTSSLFRHDSSDSLMLLTEMSCECTDGQACVRGELFVVSRSHDGLNSAIVICGPDVSSVEIYLNAENDSGAEH